MGLMAEKTDTSPGQGLRPRADTWLPGNVSFLDNEVGPSPSTLTHLSWGAAQWPGREAPPGRSLHC